MCALCFPSPQTACWRSSRVESSWVRCVLARRSENSPYCTTVREQPPSKVSDGSKNQDLLPLGLHICKYSLVLWCASCWVCVTSVSYHVREACRLNGAWADEYSQRGLLNICLSISYLLHVILAGKYIYILKTELVVNWHFEWIEEVLLKWICAEYSNVRIHSIKSNAII